MRIFFVAALLVLLGACSSTEQGLPSPSPGPASNPSASAPEIGDDATCVQVRAGIEAFNQGDYTETVARFEQAVLLAQAVEGDSASAALLSEAVQYYADLAPGDYLEASRSSADFAKYKQITLGLCTDGMTTPPGVPADPGVPA